MGKLKREDLYNFLEDHWRLYASEQVNVKNLRLWVGTKFQGELLSVKYIVDYNSEHKYCDYDMGHAIDCFNEILENAENGQAHT